MTVNLKVANNGTGSQFEHGRTLQSSANNTCPSGPQVMVRCSTTSVGRDFTFTADGTCGANITLTELQDGATNFGTVTYTWLWDRLRLVAKRSRASSDHYQHRTGFNGSRYSIPSNIVVAGAPTTIDE